MSSKASKRSARRKAAQTPLGKAQAKLAQAEQQAGEARMAVLNMRQMYRQAEQEILMLRDRLSKAETLTAAVMFATENYSVIVTSEHMQDLSDEFDRLHTEPGEDGMVVSLVVDDGDEEDEDADVSEVPADE